MLGLWNGNLPDQKQRTHKQLCEPQVTPSNAQFGEWVRGKLPLTVTKHQLRGT